MIQHAFGLMLSPRKEWDKISSSAEQPKHLLFSALFAVVPAVAFYYGVAEVGWEIRDGETTRLTSSSALRICMLFYLGQVASILCIGYFIHWMSSTYGAASTLTKGVAIAGYCATPLFIAGIVGVYPHLMTDLMVGVLAASWALYLLYTGIPIVMSIPQDRGFLFASAVVGVCLVIFVALLSATVILWDMGFAPEFTN